MWSLPSPYFIGLRVRLSQAALIQSYLSLHRGVGARTLAATKIFRCSSPLYKSMYLYVPYSHLLTYFKSSLHCFYTLMHANSCDTVLFREQWQEKSLYIFSTEAIYFWSTLGWIPKCGTYKYRMYTPCQRKLEIQLKNSHFKGECSICL
jgi:hypothetical protein